MNLLYHVCEYVYKKYMRWYNWTKGAVEMKSSEFSCQSADGTAIHVYKWAADKPKAVVQIAHGAIEHAKRYSHFASALAARGFTVYAGDHRGHGKTAGTIDNTAYFSDGKGGFSLAVDDMYTLTQRIREENPGIKVFLLGHSMGSLMARIYAARYGEAIDGLVLTGTGHVNPALVGIVRGLAKLMMLTLGRRHRSPLLQTLVFGTLNRPFGGETGSEFICSDPDVVKAYAADAFCGNAVSAEFVEQLLWGTRQAARKKTFAAYPKDLPLFVGAGQYDTMGGKNLSAVKKDVADFKSAGAADVTFQIYDGMRHEILNETEKQTVYDDIIGWIERHVDGKSRM
jgi:alpha-beta hydrolase superfamily lysophospholipase